MYSDFTVNPIGIIRSPFKKPGQAPRQGREQGAPGEIEVFEGFEDGLQDIEGCTHLIVFFWMNEANRNRLAATPPHTGKTHSVFGSRSPHRPRPIGMTVVELLGLQGRRPRIKRIDATDGAPAIDIKPYVPALYSVPHARVKHSRGDS